MPTFQQTSTIDVDAAALAQWHLSPGAFRRLTPPWERVRLLDEPAEIADGTRTVLEMKVGPIWKRWVAEHQECQPGVGFTDVQVQGPFAAWKHRHRFDEAGHQQSTLSDAIDYRLPFSLVGELLGKGFVRRKLERTFRYRHAVTRDDLERRAAEPFGGGKPMTVLVTGATGLVGRALEAFLQMRGHRMLCVTRNPKSANDVRWDLNEGVIDLPEDQHLDAVVHLAGENVAGGRWTTSRKTAILESRRRGTRLLCETLAARDQRPDVLVSASGANYYAQGTERPQGESSPRGSGFLSDVCKVWEEETAIAEEAGIRVVHLRIGVILSPAGGALAKMLPAFQFGVAGRLGAGTQRMPWITLDDVIDVIHRALYDDRYTGPINAVSPDMTTNRDFTKSLAKALKRPAIIPIPALGLETVLGQEMAAETLLADLALSPDKLKLLDYPFRHPTIEGALAYLLGRAPS